MSASLWAGLAPCCGGGRLRRASHAGSWYPAGPDELREQLRSLLQAAPCAPAGARPPKALVVPHAGLRYCGRTASHAYANLQPEAVERVVVLGPSHHRRIEGCALPAPGTAAYETPLGPVPLDVDALEELRGTGDFEEFDLRADEAEHSIEMQLPFVALWMEGSDDWELLPIIVGRLGPDECSSFARHLQPLFDDPATLFIISSDFCHWGSKFRFCPRVVAQPLTPGCPVPGTGSIGDGDPINAGIESLDLRAIELICKQDGEAFARYLEADGNTICGRNPIRLLLELLASRPGRFRMRFLHYSQSRLLGPAPGPQDSSVSYAAGLCEAIA